MSDLSLEDARAQWVLEYLQSRGGEFDDVGLTFQVEPVRREGSGDRYHSEVEVSFRRGTVFVTALFFEIARDNRILAEEKEWRHAVVRDVSDVLADESASGN